jgi:hypothetical protein
MCTYTVGTKRESGSEWCRWQRWPKIVPFVSLFLLLFLVVTTNAQSEELDPIPPVAPEGEKIIAENSSFAEDCLSLYDKLIKRSKWVLGTSLVTQSERWGEIFRVDFKIPEDDLSPLVNRLICWRTPAGFFQLNVAIGQNAPPLE